MASTISEHSTIAEILSTYPETFEVFEKYFAGACFFCPASAQETIGDGAMVHGYDKEQLILELNLRIQENELLKQSVVKKKKATPKKVTVQKAKKAVRTKKRPHK